MRKNFSANQRYWQISKLVQHSELRLQLNPLVFKSPAQSWLIAFQVTLYLHDVKDMVWVEEEEEEEEEEEGGGGRRRE